MFEQLHRTLDVAVFHRPQQRTVIFLGQFAQAHGFQVEAQEAFLFVQSVFDQPQEPTVRRLAIHRHVEQAVQPADFGVIVFRFQFVDVAGGLLEVFVGEQRDRQAQGFGLQKDAQCVSLDGVALNQWRDHRTFVGDHVKQRMGFELAQGFTDRHAADTEQVGQVLLAKGRAARNATIENGGTQGLFDDRAGQMRGNRPVDLDTAERVGLLCHYNAP
ncbi:hypothetical protein D3C84_641320 [compost metagenome]